MRKYDVYSFAQAIVDTVYQVPEALLQQIGIVKGSTQLIDSKLRAALDKALDGHTPEIRGGGTITNSLAALAQLDAHIALSCCTAEDLYGDKFIEELNSLGISSLNQPLSSGRTGTSTILIAPDGERSMCTDLGVATELNESHLFPEAIEQSSWIFFRAIYLPHQAVIP